MGGRAPPLRPDTGCTALCPFRDRERPVGQRSSVPKIDKTRRLDRENENWNHRQKLSDAQKKNKSHKRVHTAAKLIALAQNSTSAFLCFCFVEIETEAVVNVGAKATDKVKGSTPAGSDVIAASCPELQCHPDQQRLSCRLGALLWRGFIHYLEDACVCLYQRAAANLLGFWGGRCRVPCRYL